MPGALGRSQPHCNRETPVTISYYLLIVRNINGLNGGRPRGA
jgi:hypothetical protein